jgi:hypothetical protein
MTITGLFASLFLIALVFKWRHRIHLLILDPFFWICLSYIRYFGFADIQRSSALMADLANVIGFLVFTTLYFLSRRFVTKGTVFAISAYVWPIRSRIKIIGRQHRTLPLRRGAIMAMLIVCGSWAILDIYTNIIAFGSLDAALTRFYVGRPDTEVLAGTARIVNMLFISTVSIMIAFRIDGISSENTRSRWLFWLVFVVFEIVVIPRATVGYVLYPLLVMIFVDAILVKRLVIHALPYKTYLLTFPFVLAIGFLLLTVRGDHYDNPQDVIKAIDFSSLGEVVTKSGQSHSIVFEYVEKVVDTYGIEKDYLYFYTPYSILANPIPRELWPDKPYGFGKVLAIDAGAGEDSGVSFAAGLAGEGYANGGWVGIVVLTAMIGVLCGFFAKFSSELFLSPSIAHLLLAFQAWLAAQYFVRGDILSAWGQAVYPFVFSLFSLWIINKALRLRLR